MGPSFQFALLPLRKIFVGWAKARSAVPTCCLCDFRVGFASLSPPYKERKGSGTPTDATSNLPCCWHGRASSRDAHAYRRPTAALTRGSSPPQGPAPGHVSWDVAERRSVGDPLPGQIARSLCGCYPPL